MKHRKLWGGTALSLALMGVLSAPTVAAADPLPVSAARTVPVARTVPLPRAVPAPARESLSLVLPLVANGAGLSRFATAVTTPGSPRYRQYRPIAWLAHRFGASLHNRMRVVNFLHHAGAAGVHADVTGLFVEARMPAATARRLFATPLLEVHDARGGSYTMPGRPARLPAGLRGSATGVIGLDTRDVALAPSDAQAALASSSQQPLTGTPRGCSAALGAGGFSPNQYLSAYGFDGLHGAGHRGQGERVALIEIDGFRRADISTFAQCFGLTTPRITSFRVGLPRLLPAGLEATLDLEILQAAAPSLKSMDVYESGSRASDVVTALTAPLFNGAYKPQVISVSLGLCEAQNQAALGTSGISAVERALEETAASGITVLGAAGDSGSAECTWPAGAQAGQTEPQLAVFFPASSPWVTGVGGTNLVLNADNSIRSQEVWNDGDASTPAGLAGGGGFSELFGRPAYQDGVVASDRRALPDVALLADTAPGYDIYCTATSRHSGCLGGWEAVGGTSAATPLLAGGLSLVDQVLRRQRLQDLGGVNPLLYATGRNTTEASAVFSDVTVGSNDITHPPLGCCTAGPGFDEASGWGGVNVSGLARVALATQPRIVYARLTVPTQRPVHSKRLLAIVSCTGACRMGAFARVSIGGKRRFTDHSKLYRLASAGRRTVRIRFTRRQLKRLRSALRQRVRVNATVVGATVDAVGNIEQSARRTLRITG